MSTPTNRNDADRRLGGMIGMGKIVDLNIDDYTARVKDGEITTGWLRMGLMRAFGDLGSWPYAVGEEVGYATISGDMQDGFIICALANGQSPAQASPGVFKAKSGGGFELTGDITLTGKLTASDDVIAQGISLTKHKHPGVVRGTALTEKPA